MKNYIFNIGLNKSGTTSLTHALEILGISSLHYTYKSTPLENIIYKNKKKNKNLFKGLDHMYQAFSDFAGERCYQELYQQYPNSKFILTTRPFNDWFESYISMVRIVMPYRLKTKKLKRITYENAHYRYFNTTQEIREFFKDKPGQFIELKICEGDGWKELCNFLSMPIPDVDFPWSNKTIE